MKIKSPKIRPFILKKIIRLENTSPRGWLHFTRILLYFWSIFIYFYMKRVEINRGPSINKLQSASFIVASLSPMAVAFQFCRLCIRPDTLAPGSGSLRRRKPSSLRCSSGNDDAPSPSVVMDSDFDAKTFRKNLTRSDNYDRKGFGHKEETLKLMNREYTSEFPLNFLGFCWMLCFLKVPLFALFLVS